MVCCGGERDLVPLCLCQSVSNSFLPSTGPLHSQEDREKGEFVCVSVCVCLCVLEGGEATEASVHPVTVDGRRASPCVVRSVYSKVTGEPARMMTRCLWAAPDTR